MESFEEDKGPDYCAYVHGGNAEWDIVNFKAYSGKNPEVLKKKLETYFLDWVDKYNKRLKRNYESNIIKLR